MLVAAQVSSMKTRRSMSRRPWLSRQARRAERLDGRPHGGDADGDAALALGPCDKLSERHIGMRGNVRGECINMMIELAPGTAEFRQRRDDARVPPSRQRLVNVGDADLEQRRDLIDPTAAIHGRQNARPQVLRICLPWLPTHLSPSHRDDRSRITVRRICESLLIPVSLKML
jgi:hypothetical protein